MCAGASKDVLKDNTPLPATLHAWRAATETDPGCRIPSNCSATSCPQGAARGSTKGSWKNEQVAIEVEAFPFLLEKAGMLGVYVIGQKGVPLETLDKLIDEEVAKVKKDGVTEEEFQKARNNKEAEFASSFGTMSEAREKPGPLSRVSRQRQSHQHGTRAVPSR
jgi:hypothetical protein